MRVGRAGAGAGAGAGVRGVPSSEDKDELGDKLSSDVGVMTALSNSRS